MPVSVYNWAPGSEVKIGDAVAVVAPVVKEQTIDLGDKKIPNIKDSKPGKEEHKSGEEEIKDSNSLGKGNGKDASVNNVSGKATRSNNEGIDQNKNHSVESVSDNVSKLSLKEDSTNSNDCKIKPLYNKCNPAIKKATKSIPLSTKGCMPVRQSVSSDLVEKKKSMATRNSLRSNNNSSPSTSVTKKNFINSSTSGNSSSRLKSAAPSSATKKSSSSKLDTTNGSLKNSSDKGKPSLDSVKFKAESSGAPTKNSPKPTLNGRSKGLSTSSSRGQRPGAVRSSGGSRVQGTNHITLLSVRVIAPVMLVVNKKPITSGQVAASYLVSQNKPE